VPALRLLGLCSYAYRGYPVAVCLGTQISGYRDRAVQSGLERFRYSAGDEDWCAIDYSVRCVLRRDYLAKKNFKRIARRAGGVGLV
jgi:hypothetical protein